MKLKNIAIFALLAIVVVLSFRSCGGEKVERSTKIVETDTVIVVVPDSGWHRPTPERIDTVVVVPVDEIQHWRRLYEKVKGELAKQGEVGSSCEDEVRRLQSKLRRAEESLSSCDLIIESLNKKLEDYASVKEYAGVDSTENYVHRYRIRSHGLVPGGYEYRINVKRQVVTRRETITNYIYRRNSFALLGGIGEGGKVAGIQYARQGRVFGAVGQLQVDEKSRFGVLAGLKINF